MHPEKIKYTAPDSRPHRRIHRKLCPFQHKQRSRLLLSEGGAVIGYLLLLSIFFGFQITKLFDGKQFLLLLLGTGILMTP